jgi:hypothetical protein
VPQRAFYFVIGTLILKKRRKEKEKKKRKREEKGGEKKRRKEIHPGFVLGSCELSIWWAQGFPDYFY